MASTPPKPPHYWLLATPWLVFLVIPITAIAVDETALAIKIAGWIAIAGFAAVYTACFRDQPTILRSGHTDVIIALAVMTAATIVVAAIEPWAAPSMLPFFPSFVNFLAPDRVAIGVNLTAVTAAIISAVLSDGEFWYITLIVGGVAAFTWLVRIFERREHLVYDHREQLAATDERLRIARDVHDVLGHSLTAVILKTELTSALLQRVEATPASAATLAQARAEVVGLDSVARRALADIRSTVGGLRVHDLDEEIAASTTVLGDAGVTVVMRGMVADVPDEQRQLFAWVVREAVTNIVRHAEATQVTIDVSPGRLVISDDGCGIGNTDHGNGLRGLAERVDAAIGQLTITDAEHGGTRIEAAL